MVEQIVIYGTNWCADCIRARRFLRERGVAFQWVNIDQDRDAEKLVLQTNRGMRSVPTILFPDGSLLIEPSNRKLEEKLAELAALRSAPSPG